MEEHFLPANMRKIQPRGHNVMHLVRGGRWFLVVSAPGEITVSNLEVPEITGSILVEPQSDMDRQLVRQLAVNINESSVLTLDLAIIQDIFGAYFSLWFFSEFNVYK
jgi:hypothetical protein